MIHNGQIRWEALVLFVIVLVSLTVYGCVRNQNELSELQTKEMMLKYAYSQKEMERNDLQNKIKTIDTNAYVVARARSEFGYIMDGETRFEVINPEILDNYTTDEMQVILDDMAQRE